MNMRKYRLIYVPIGREDKEWIHIYASNLEAAVKKAEKYGVIINIIEENDY